MIDAKQGTHRRFPSNNKAVVGNSAIMAKGGIDQTRWIHASLPGGDEKIESATDGPIQ